MGYHIEDKYIFATSIEHEIKYSHEGIIKRGRREKASPEQIKKQNQWNREKYVRRLIKGNFKEGDLFITLKYPRGEKTNPERIEADFKSFLKRMRNRYKKMGVSFRWIARMEIGAKGGSHIHILINNAADSLLWVKECWTPQKFNVESCDNIRMNELGGYMTKLPDEQIEGQMSFLTPEQRKQFVKFRSSRNLKRPEEFKERERISRLSIMKILRDGLVATPGYYIDKNSIRTGVNPCNGERYIHYNEILLEKKPSQRKQTFFDKLKNKLGKWRQGCFSVRF